MHKFVMSCNGYVENVGSTSADLPKVNTFFIQCILKNLLIVPLTSSKKLLNSGKLVAVDTNFPKS